MASCLHLFLSVFLSLLHLSKEGCFDHFNLNIWKNNSTLRIPVVKGSTAQDTIECTLWHANKTYNATEFNLLDWILKDCYYNKKEELNTSCDKKAASNETIYGFHLLCLVAKLNKVKEFQHIGSQIKTMANLIDSINDTDSPATAPPPSPTAPVPVPAEQDEPERKNSDKNSSSPTTMKLSTLLTTKSSASSPTTWTESSAASSTSTQTPWSASSTATSTSMPTTWTTFPTATSTSLPNTWTRSSTAASISLPNTWTTFPTASSTTSMPNSWTLSEATLTTSSPNTMTTLPTSSSDILTTLSTSPSAASKTSPRTTLQTSSSNTEKVQGKDKVHGPKEIKSESKSGTGETSMIIILLLLSVIGNIIQGVNCFLQRRRKKMSMPIPERITLNENTGTTEKSDEQYDYHSNVTVL